MARYNSSQKLSIFSSYCTIFEYYTSAAAFLLGATLYLCRLIEYLHVKEIHVMYLVVALEDSLYIFNQFISFCVCNCMMVLHNKKDFFSYLLLWYVLSCNIAMQKFKVFPACILLSFLVAAENFSVFVMHEMDFRECSMHSKSKWFSALFESPYFTLHKIGTTRIFLHGTTYTYT